MGVMGAVPNDLLVEIAMAVISAAPNTVLNGFTRLTGGPSGDTRVGPLCAGCFDLSSTLLPRSLS